MSFTKIIGTGSYLPARIMKNAELESMVDTSDDWIVERTGIHERRIASEDESASSMAEQASIKALTMAGISANDLDLILVATCTPDRVFPSTACMLQDRLGVTRQPAFDISAACSGFIYALSVADQYIRSGTMQNVLVVGSEVMSRVVDWHDRATCVLFGDGAGAVVLQASEEPGIISTHLHADGQHKDMLYVPHPLCPSEDKGEAATLKMKGNETFKIAVNTLGEIAAEAMAHPEFRERLDWLIPHQANLRIITAMAKKLKTPMEKVVVTVGEHGNTSAASIPLALDVAIRDGRVQRGHHLLLEGFGGGLTWGSALIKY